MRRAFAHACNISASVIGVRLMRQALPLDTPYACVVSADVPVAVQFARRDTSRGTNAFATSMAAAGR